MAWWANNRETAIVVRPCHKNSCTKIKRSVNEFKFKFMRDDGAISPPTWAVTRIRYVKQFITILQYPSDRCSRRLNVKDFRETCWKQICRRSLITFSYTHFDPPAIQVRAKRLSSCYMMFKGSYNRVANSCRCTSLQMVGFHVRTTNFRPINPCLSIHVPCFAIGLYNTYIICNSWLNTFIIVCETFSIFVNAAVR